MHLRKLRRKPRASTEQYFRQLAEINLEAPNGDPKIPDYINGDVLRFNPRLKYGDGRAPGLVFFGLGRICEHKFTTFRRQGSPRPIMRSRSWRSYTKRR